MKHLTLLFLLGIIVSSYSTASAHYLWATIDKKSSQEGTAKIYFEEAPVAGDGHYMDHFSETSEWSIRTVEAPSAKPLKIADIRQGDRRWLQSELSRGAPRSIDGYGKFGVYAYGKTKVLLHYYARFLDVDSHEDLHELGRAEQLDFDIVPHDMEDEVELKVLWRGVPAADRMVHIRGPNKFRENLKTDPLGRVRFTPQGAGEYTFRSSVEENTPGKEGDEEYSLIRHNGTLIMQLPLQK